MENLYLHNSFIFVGNTPRTIESAIDINFNQGLAVYSPLLHNQDASAQEIYLTTFPYMYGDDEYMGSTSPYDDDGCQ